MLYKINGENVPALFNGMGDAANAAYDIDGSLIWPGDDKAFSYSVHLDIGSKYISLRSIKAIIDSMASASRKIRLLQLDFSKNRGFRLALDDSIVTAADGKTYDLTPCYGNSTWDNNVDTKNNYWLTQNEMEEAIRYARRKNIEICPCFTMPGNMFAFLSPYSEFWYGTDIWGRTTLDFTNPTAVSFIVAVVKKYARFFASCGCRYWNFGCDEVGTQTGSGFNDLYNSGKFGLLTNFINTIADTVISDGFKPRAWNDAILWAGDTSEQYYINRDIQVCYWERLKVENMQYASVLADNGFSLINSPNGMYYCPASRYPALSQAKFDNFVQNKTTFNDGSVVPTAIGAQWCIWFPNPKGISEENAVETIQTYLGYYGHSIHQYDEEGD